MRSINYADSATQTLHPRCFLCDASFVLFPALFHPPPPLPRSISLSRLHHLPYSLFVLSLFLRSLVPHLRRLQCSPATQTTPHFEILHGRCNERSYRDYNAVTSTLHCDSGRPDLRLPFYYCRSISLHQCSSAVYGRFFVFS